MAPFLWMGFNCLKAMEQLRGGSLLFTNKFPETPGTRHNKIYLFTTTFRLLLAVTVKFSHKMLTISNFYTDFNKLYVIK